MKCPRCGTKNGDANKFCRECGQRLDVLAEQEAEGIGGQTCPPDEVALSEEWLDTWQLYSKGDLDSALAKIEVVVRCFPESASAHSLYALICERKADRAFEKGESDLGQDLLKMAIQHYEKIVHLNPDSAGDREKLARLKMKVGARAKSGPIPRVTDFKAAFKAVPMPAKVAAAVFLAVLMLAIVFLPGGERRQVKPASAQSNEEMTMRPATGLAAPQAVQRPTPAPPAPQVYTYTQPAAPAAVPVPATALAPPTATTHKAPPAINLPSIAPVKVSPLPPVVTTKKPAPGDTKPKPDSKPAQPSAPDGSSTLAQAIVLNSQGRTNEALDSAQEAIRLYQADVDAGRNATVAKRGIENAQKMIRIWQSSGNGAGQ